MKIMKGLHALIFLSILLPHTVLCAPGDIVTVAGGGLGDGGAATKATLNGPFCAAVDSTGNLYLVDRENNRIRKVTAGGTITTVAGNGTQGYSGDNGTATAAMLNLPTDVALDNMGNLYIADEFNHRIRKMAIETGIITTVAGNGTEGYSGDNGAAVAASLSSPCSVAVDSAGNLFIADGANHRIRKVAAGTGIITTVAGNGARGYTGDNVAATAAALFFPTGVAVDRNGNIFIADHLNQRIRKVAAVTGIITTLAGAGYAGYSGDGGPAEAALIDNPNGLAVDDAGNLFIADTLNNRIRKVAAGTGIITTVAGGVEWQFNLGDNGLATAANLTYPNGVTVDGAGNILIADTLAQRIRKVAADTGIITTVVGNGLASSAGSYSGDGGTATAATLNHSSGVAVNSAGNLYIVDSENNRIRKVAAGTGIITTVAGNGARGYAGDGGLATEASLFPCGIAQDSAGNLFIADCLNNRIRKVDAGTGIITTVAGNGVAGYSGDGGAAIAATLFYPDGIAVDSAGNLFIADDYNHRIRKVAAGTGIITTVAGNGAQGYAGDNGAATEATLNYPNGVTLDSAGNLYIADSPNYRKVAAGTGIITTVAGNGTHGYSGDGGAATLASLDGPTGIALDSAGNFYIADIGNNRIRMVAAGTGIITTVAGNGTQGYSGDNSAATAAALNSPTGVAVDSAGNLYIADYDNNRIRMVIGSVIPVVIALPDGGTFISAQDVTLTSSKPATIYYTADGSDPTTNGTRQNFATSGLITIRATTTLKYYAVATDGHASGVATRTYTIIPQPFSLNLIFAGTGSGSVHSSPAGIACSTGPSGICTVQFDQGLQVTLTASPSAGSVFAGWTGACTNDSGDCVTIMNANKSVTSVFNYFPVRIYGSPVMYISLQSAYDAATSDDVLQAQAAVLVESPILDKPAAVTIKGGYDNEFNAVTGITTLQGTLTLKKGTVTIDGLMIR